MIIYILVVLIVVCLVAMVFLAWRISDLEAKYSVLEDCCRELDRWAKAVSDYLKEKRSAP